MLLANNVFATFFIFTTELEQEKMLLNSWNTLCLLAPWLIFGALVAGLMHVVLPADWLRRKLKGTSGIFKAVGLGVPLPLCSCGVIPAGVGLKRNGASDGASIGFLISTPQTGVDSILVSASFLGWPFAIFKMILAAVTGIIGGLLSKDTVTDEQRLLDSHTHVHHGNWLVRTILHSVDVIQSIWVWLVVGVLISAAISVWIVPNEWFQQLGQSSLLVSLFLMLLISLPLYVCATASVPIAAALVAGGMPTAAALVFLVAGPATNLATIGAIYSQFGVRNTVVYLGTIIVGSIVGALGFDWAFGNSVNVVVGEHHEHLTWFSIASGILLAAMFTWFLVQQVTRYATKIKQQKQRTGLNDSISLPIHGMNCQNCVEKIECALQKSPGVRFVQVDLPSETVVVEGNIQPDTIRQVIQEAGFVVPPETGPTSMDR